MTTATRSVSRRGIAGFAAYVLAATLVLAGAPGTADATSHLACGSVITSSGTHVLHTNLQGCPDDGIVVQASDVVLDLGGNTVSGLSVAGEPTPQEGGTGAGVLVDGVDNVTVKNGTIEHFDGGVVLDNRTSGAGDHTVESLTIRHNQNGPLSEWGEGIGLWESNNNVIDNNTVEDNGRWAGIGLYGDLQTSGSSNNTITNNAVTKNQRSIWTVNENIGIRIEPYSSENVVADNTVTENALDGIAVFAHSHDNAIEGNDVRDNGFHAHVTHRFGDGIRLHGGAAATATGNIVESNTVCGNYGNGIGATARNNSIVDNTSGTPSGGCDLNAQGDPLNLSYHDLHDYNDPCANTWSGNRTEGSAQPNCTLNP